MSDRRMRAGNNVSKDKGESWNEEWKKNRSKKMERRYKLGQKLNSKNE